MKIAILGTRGVPARYGGFETCAEELGKRLAARGHAVSVFNRRVLYPDRLGFYQGMTLHYAPCLKIRALETLSHTFFSILQALPGKYDVWIVFNCANAPLLILPLLFGRKIVLNVDGLEWKRGKWSRGGKAYFRFVERLAARLPAGIVTDSMEIRKYFREKYGRETHYIPYGASVSSGGKTDVLGKLGLRPGGYFLQVTRFEPENNPLMTVRAFEGLATEKKLVLVGGSKYRTPYQEELAATKDPRVIFTGFIYDKAALGGLLAHAFAYVHGNEVGGTNPALLEAMAAGAFVISRDAPFNVEVLGDAGIYFGKDAEDLREKMAWTLANDDRRRAGAERGRAIIAERYNWDSITGDYERLIEG